MKHNSETLVYKRFLSSRVRRHENGESRYFNIQSKHGNISISSHKNNIVDKSFDLFDDDFLGNDYFNDIDNIEIFNDKV